MIGLVYPLLVLLRITVLCVGAAVVSFAGVGLLVSVEYVRDRWKRGKRP